MKYEIKKNIAVKNSYYMDQFCSQFSAENKFENKIRAL